MVFLTEYHNSTDFYCVINVIGIILYIGFVVWGWVPGWWLLLQGGGGLCVWRSPLHYLGYTLEWSLVLEHVCAGGGGVM